MPEIKRLLLTGAAGIVGTALRPFLQEHYESVLLSDIKEISDLASNESFQRADLANFEEVNRIVQGVDGVIHLGGMVGAHYTFDDVLGPNLIGTHNVFESARLSGVARIIYASSHHAVGFTPRGRLIDHRTAPRPNGEYGLSKAYGEAAASYYADNYAMEILSIRIGYVGNDVSTERRLHTWVSPRDLFQLVRIGLETPELHHEIVYGISEVPDPFFDNRNAIRLGYKPLDAALEQVPAKSAPLPLPDPGTIEGGVVGGGFANAGFEGNPDKVFSKQ